MPQNDWFFGEAPQEQPNTYNLEKTQQDFPNTNISESKTEPYDFFFNGNQPTVYEPERKDEGNLGNSVLKGILKGASAFGSPLASEGWGLAMGSETGRDMYDKARIMHDAMMNTPKEEQERQLNEKLPSPKSEVGATLEGAGEQLGNPLNYFGGAALTAGVTSGGITAWRNYVSPDTPVANELYGIAGGILAPSVYNSLGKGAKFFTANGGNTATQMQDILGITGKTAAGIGEDTSWPRVVRSLRESPVSNSINNAEALGREQIGNVFENQTRELGNAQTKEQAGQVLKDEIGTPDFSNPIAQGWINTAKRDLAHRELTLNQQVDPQNTLIPTSPILNDIHSQIDPILGAANLDPSSQQLLTRIRQGFDNWTNAGNWSGLIPLSVITANKKAVGDMLDTNLFSQSDTTKQHLTDIWNILSKAQREAYHANGRGAEFDQLQRDWHEYFDGRDLVKNYIQQNAGPAFDSSMNEASRGGQKLEQLFRLVPGARDEMAAYKVREMGGASQDRPFDPKLFFKNWQDRANPILSPEAKNTLFDPEVRAAYDRIAKVSEEQARSEAARNSSGTGGTSEILNFVKRLSDQAVKFALPGAALGYSYSQQYEQDNPDKIRAAGIGSLATYATAMTIGPKLMTSPAFLKFLATDPPIKDIPLGMKILASNNPDLANEFTAISNYVNSKFHLYESPPNNPGKQILEENPDYQLRKSEEHHFAEGGLASDPLKDTAGISNGLSSMTNMGFKEGGIFSNQQGYCGGGPANGYLGGGMATSPFGVDLNGNNMVGYAAGGPVKSLLDSWLIGNYNIKSPSFSEQDFSNADKEFRDSAFGTPQNEREFRYEWNLEPDNYAREIPLRNRLSNREDSPVWPHNIPFNDLAEDSGNAKGYSKGGIIVMKQGGPLSNTTIGHQSTPPRDPRPSYNPQLPRVSVYAEGGPTDEIGEGDFVHPTKILDSIVSKGGPRSMGRSFNDNSPLQNQTANPSLIDKFLEDAALKGNLYWFNKTPVETVVSSSTSRGTNLDMSRARPYHETLPEAPWKTFDVRKDSGYEGIYPTEKAAQQAIKGNNNLDYGNPRSIEEMNPTRTNDQLLIHRLGEAVNKINTANDFKEGGYFQSPQMGYAEGGPIEKVTNALVQAFPQMSPEVARGAAKYMYKNESGLDPNIVNPTSGAYGIGQMLGSRKAALFAMSGTNKPTFDQEVAHIVHELNTTEATTLKKLLSGSTEKHGYDIWGRDFERPGATALAKAGVAYNGGNIDDTGYKPKGKGFMVASATNNVPNDNSHSIIDNFENEQTQPDENIENLNNAIDTADWIEPHTKFAAKEILKNA